MNRSAEIARATRETRITGKLTLDGDGNSQIATGLGFLDHMLAALAKHARFDIELSCKGDLYVDDHHTAEDCALALGAAFDEALGERRAIRRFGHAYAPLDEALARTVVDISSRPFARIELGLVRERLGDIACENLTHFLSSFATAARITMHVELLSGVNDHHRIEAAFKSTALALRAAIARDEHNEIPSTKGSLS